MLLGSFDRLLGESTMAPAIDVARIVDEAGLYAIALGEHVALHGSFAAATTRVKLSHCLRLGNQSQVAR